MKLIEQSVIRRDVRKYVFNEHNPNTKTETNLFFDKKKNRIKEWETVERMVYPDFYYFYQPLPERNSAHHDWLVDLVRDKKLEYEIRDCILGNLHKSGDPETAFEILIKYYESQRFVTESVENVCDEFVRADLSIYEFADWVEKNAWKNKTLSKDVINKFEMMYGYIFRILEDTFEYESSGINYTKETVLYPEEEIEWSDDGINIKMEYDPNLGDIHNRLIYLRFTNGKTIFRGFDIAGKPNPEGGVLQLYYGANPNTIGQKIFKYLFEDRSCLHIIFEDYYI